MLEIDIDTKYGILFVRLFGKLTKKTRNKLNKEVISLVDKVGIQNMVINIQNINELDETGKKTLEKCIKICKKSILCINPRQTNVIDNLQYVTDELSAVNFINA